MFHIRDLGMTSSGLPPSPGADALECWVWFLFFSPLPPDTGTKKKDLPLWLNPSHSNQCSTCSYTLLNDVTIVKNKIKENLYGPIF